MKLFVVRVDDRNDLITLHEYIGPVVCRVVIGNGIGEAGIGVSHISSLGTAKKTLGELGSVNIR